MRLLVCGGRDYDARFFLYSFLDAVHFVHGPIDVLINGGARGADTLAREWADHREIFVETYMAEWAKFGKAAGYIRNAKMLNSGNPGMVVCFPGGKGTANMKRIAEGACVSVVIAHPETIQILREGK